MRRTILMRFCLVLVVALFINSAVSYYFMGNKLLGETEKNLRDMIHMIEYTLDYDKDILEQVTGIVSELGERRARITVIRSDGTVLADTDAGDPGEMENHLEREEMKAALQTGEGCATRFSQTLQKNMLYVAEKSADGQYVIRAAVAYAGLRDYLPRILPALLAGVAAAFLIAVVVAIRLSDTITKPLMEMSTELQKVHSDNWDFHFKKYKYEELNIISESTTKLAEEVKEHISRLEFEKKVRQEFFSNASHELKTPITAIRGYAELLDTGFEADEKTKQTFVKRILKSTENMTQLIEDILMISRLETKDAEVTFTLVRMGPMMQEVMEAVEPIAREYQVTLHEECEPIAVEASANHIRELLMNLIVNGIKYNHPGGNVWVRVGSSGHNMVLRVRDDGMGISQNDQQRVFERFFRVDKGRSKKMGGTGLGLSIVKHIVEFNDGYMQLKSAPGKGSEFVISIPLERNPV